MSVVWIREQQNGISLSGSGPDPSTWSVSRTILVRVDRPYAIKDGNPVSIHSAVAGAVGIKWGDPHYDPALAAAKVRCSDISITSEGDGMLYRCEYQYKVLNFAIDAVTKLPETKWSFSSSKRNFPWELHWHLGRAEWIPTLNSAGDLIPGIEKEVSSGMWNVEAYFPDWDTAMGFARWDGSLNSTAWYGGAPWTWLLTIKSLDAEAYPEPENTLPGDPTADRQGADGTLLPKQYIKLVFTLEHRRETWRVKALDVGMLERCNADGTPSKTGNNKQLIKDSFGRAVTRPVALDDGIAAAVGTQPKIVDNGEGFIIHEWVDFHNILAPPPASII